MSRGNDTPEFTPIEWDPPRPTGRGGRRPGAGAPRGNRNAWRHGRRSALAAPILSRLPAATRELTAIAVQRASEAAVRHAGTTTQGRQPKRPNTPARDKP